MTQKPFLTIDEQINRLESLGITIDKNKDKKTLESNSYFNVVNGYKEPFLFLKQKDKYKKGTKFSEIFALYTFDKKLRIIILSEIMSVEAILKTNIIYQFLLSSSDYDNSNDRYLKIGNYYNKEKTQDVLRTISEFQNVISKHFNRSNSVTHYLTNYGHVPLWVLSTHLTFGQINSFYESLSISIRQSISKKFKLQDNAFGIFLRVILKARNYCAHNNRLYCSKFLSIPTTDKNHFPIQNEFTTENDSFFNILISLKYFMDKKSFKSMINSIESLFKELEHKLLSITVDVIKDKMGLPNNWMSLVS